MRLRQRLIGLLVGMLSLGAAVAMFPTGSEAAGTVEAVPAAAPSPECSAVKIFVRAEKALVANMLPGAIKKQYNAKLAEIQDAACGGDFTCATVQSLIADLRAIRGDLLGPIEAQLQALENGVLQLVCSS